MDFSSILKLDAVKVVSSYTSKKRMFMDLGTTAADVYGLNAEEVTDALLERESLGPTGVGHGIALPHARVSGLDKIVSIFLRVEKPSEFSSVDRQPVDLVYCLLAPHQAGVEHLKALALVSRTLRDASVCTKLRANGEPSTLHAIFTETRGSKAA
jgi:PTS system nitrogen regulatory IIA component